MLPLSIVTLSANVEFHLRVLFYFQRINEWMNEEHLVRFLEWQNRCIKFQVNKLYAISV